VIVELLATNAVHQSDLSSRVTALQTTSNALTVLNEQVQRITTIAAAQVAPTRALGDGIGTVLDGPGKYMYENGLDEEWRVLQEEADKLYRNTENTPPSSQQKAWNYS
jgi:hypothetical protein